MVIHFSRAHCRLRCFTRIPPGNCVRTKRLKAKLLMHINQDQLANQLCPFSSGSQLAESYSRSAADG
jgi:hypothetical protein